MICQHECKPTKAVYERAGIKTRMVLDKEVSLSQTLSEMSLQLYV